MLIVGLGNSGANYENTRHNVGFIAAGMISDRYNFSWSKKSKFNAEIAMGEVELNSDIHKKLILCKPTTFMNLSSLAVQPLASFYKIPPEDILVIHDDVDLPLGKVKYKFAGGAGGHNGLKSIDSAIGNNYHRIKIGIGRPEHASHDVSDYVLGKFTDEEISILHEKIRFLIDNLDLIITKDFECFKKKLSEI